MSACWGDRPPPVPPGLTQSRLSAPGATVTVTYTGYYVTDTATGAHNDSRWERLRFELSLAPAGIITGTVTNAGTGSGASTVTMTCTGLSSTTTNSSGVYTFSAVPAGSYTVTPTGRTNYYAAATGVGVTISTAGQTITQNFTVNPLGTVTGTVTNATTSAAISGATVLTPGVTAVTTNSAGAYTLGSHSVPYGSVVTASDGTGYTIVTAAPAITADSTTSGVNFALTPAGSVSGTLTDASTGAAVSGATVSVPGLASVTTNSAGAYSLSNVANGSQTVTVTDTNYYVTSSATVTVTANNTTTENFALTPVGNVSGTVTNLATGAAIVGATVSAPGVTSVISTSTGYSLPNVPRGSTVTVTTSGYANATAAPAITAGQTTTWNFLLTPLGIVSGKVTSAGTGAAISGATVSAPGVSSVTTGSTGTYSLSNVPYATLVTVTANGFANATATPPITAGQTIVQNFELQPPAAATPTFSPGNGAGSTFPLTVVISSATAGATIYYTTDGSQPSSSHGTAITSGASVVVPNNNTTLKAIAYATGYNPSAIATALYSVLADSVNDFSGIQGNNGWYCGEFFTPDPNTTRPAVDPDTYGASEFQELTAYDSADAWWWGSSASAAISESLKLP